MEKEILKGGLLRDEVVEVTRFVFVDREKAFYPVNLLDTHPGHESLMVLPQYRRYRDVTEPTRTGRRAGDIHVIPLDSAGAITNERWSPSRART